MGKGDILDIPAEAVNSVNTQSTLKLFIVFYSMYGHVEKLAKRMKKGAEGVQGVEAVLFRVPETLPADVLELMKVPPKDPEIPEIVVAELATADGFLFGFPTSTGTQGGGQETTAWTAITQLAHHGMLFVPIGCTFGAGMFNMDSIRGGSPYGAGVYAGDGTREPSETELALAEHQGKYMAGVVKRLLSQA
ncbi:hypothetical protein like AT4G36750 [Hibiscus trionum]|uniref:Flavodoxin-like domain-containing protein n=1 Tax=Hibiscus trionum TaxID=183268 RepID=A0A9W7GZQ8_HIBTR|nr:hypothetical protein like AT4G36750 [Hibiscus trionum]